MLPSEAFTAAHYKIALKVLAASLSEENLQRELLKIQNQQLQEYYVENEEQKEQVNVNQEPVTSPPVED